MISSIHSALITRVVVLSFFCWCSAGNAFVQQGPSSLFHALIIRTTTTAARIGPQSPRGTELKSAREIMMLPMTTVPLWPYMGCSGQCAGGPLGLFVALALCGVGLPLSEDVLLIGLAPRLLLGVGAESSVAPLLYKLLYVPAAIAGVAAADTLTVLMGRALRVNVGLLAEQAPGFLGRMLSAVGKQLAVESKRDNDRLREQIEGRLRSASINLGEQLRNLQEAFAIVPTDGDATGSSALPETPPSVWERLKTSNNLMRRITCNTRTSLAAWGQTSAALTKIVTSRRYGSSWSIAPSSSSSQPSSSSSPDSRSRLAGIDNRLAFGQRWPLALLTGFSADTPISSRRYFVGAAVAAATITLPVQLLLGVALRGWARVMVYFAIAAAQLCRYGPIWGAVFVAIADTVKLEIEDARDLSQS